jgi:hypothetical protein
VTIHIPLTVLFWLAVAVLIYAVLFGRPLGVLRWPAAGGAALAIGWFWGGGYFWVGVTCAVLGVLAMVDALRKR